MSTPTPMNAAELAESRQRCEAAIAGPHAQLRGVKMLVLENEALVTVSTILHIDVPRLHATIEALQAEVERLRDRSTECCFCGVQCRSVVGLKEHSASCPAHPMSDRIAELEAQLARAREIAAAAVDESVRETQEKLAVALLRERVRELESANAGLVEDAERLNWLDTQLVWIGVYGEFKLKARYYAGSGYAMRVRDACDAGRTAERAAARQPGEGA